MRAVKSITTKLNPFHRALIVSLFTSLMALLLSGTFYFYIYYRDFHARIKEIAPFLLLFPVFFIIYILIIRRWLKPVLYHIHKDPRKDLRNITLNEVEKGDDLLRIINSFPPKAFLLSILFWVLGSLIIGLGASLFLGWSTLDCIITIISGLSGGAVFSLITFFLFKIILKDTRENILKNTEVKELSRPIITIQQKLVLSFLIVILISLFFSFILGYTRAVHLIQGQTAKFAHGELKRIMMNLGDIQEINEDMLTELSDRFTSKSHGDIFFMDIHGEKIYGSLIEEGYVKGLIKRQYDQEVKNSSSLVDPETKDIYVLHPMKDVGLYLCERLLWADYGKGLKDLSRKLILLILGTIVIVLVVAMLIAHDISDPLRGMVRLARHISGGDLRKDIGIVNEDEVGELALGLLRMVRRLRATLMKVNTTARELNMIGERIRDNTSSMSEGSSIQASSVEETASSVEVIDKNIKDMANKSDIITKAVESSSSSVGELGAAIGEVSLHVENLDQLVEEVTSSISEMSSKVHEVAYNIDNLSSVAEETASAMIEMDASIKNVKGNAEKTTKMTERVMIDAKDGREVVGKTIEAMGRIKMVSEHAFGVIADLMEKVVEIGKILTLIDEVAEDTNLLALNASIIAAQVEEHGYNFSVVADEIRDMAERTEAHTEDISSIIRSVQVESQRALEAVRDSMGVVKDGMVLSERAGEALEKILEGSSMSVGMMKEIASASVEQTESSRRVSESMERVRVMLEGISIATNEQARGSGQIRDASEKMRGISYRVRQTINEQSDVSKGVIKNIENIKEMIESTNRFMKEQSINSEKMSNNIMNIRSIANENLNSSTNLDKSVNNLTTNTETFNECVSYFKIE